MTGTNNPQRDLATIRNEDSIKHRQKGTDLVATRYIRVAARRGPRWAPLFRFVIVDKRNKLPGGRENDRVSFVMPHLQNLFRVFLYLEQWFSEFDRLFILNEYSGHAS